MYIYEFQIKFRPIRKLTKTISSIYLSLTAKRSSNCASRNASETRRDPSNEKERAQNLCKLAQLISESTRDDKKGRSISNYESNPGRLAELGEVSPQNSPPQLASRSHPSRLKRCNVF